MRHGEIEKRKLVWRNEKQHQIIRKRGHKNCLVDLVMEVSFRKGKVLESEEGKGLVSGFYSEEMSRESELELQSEFFFNLCGGTLGTAAYCTSPG
jgi:hypothetical protein